MKKILLLVFACTMGFVSMKAQGGGGRRSPEERAKMQTEQMNTTLKLSLDQLPKVDSINLKFAKEQQSGFGGQGGGMEERLKAMKKIQDEKNSAFKKLLTDKQYADYLQMVEDQKQKMIERMKNRPDGGQ